MTEESLELRQQRGEPLDRVTLKMPLDSRILTLQMQYGLPVLWVEVIPSRPPVPRNFVIVGTGTPVPDDARAYVGTWQQQGGSLVFHLYEV